MFDVPERLLAFIRVILIQYVVQWGANKGVAMGRCGHKLAERCRKSLIKDQSP